MSADKLNQVAKAKLFDLIVAKLDRGELEIQWKKEWLAEARGDHLIDSGKSNKGN